MGYDPARQPMPRRPRPCAPPVALLLWVAAASAQTVIGGGGPARTDCHGAWIAPAPNRGTTGIDCQDGDPACDLDRTVDGRCSLPVGVCLHLDTDRRCGPRPIESTALRAHPPRLLPERPVPLPRPPAVPVNGPTCGSDVVIPLPLRTDRRGRLTPSKRITLRMTTRVRGSDRPDSDRLRLRCVPNRGAGRCPGNPAGGVGELALTTIAVGTDLDLGWTGDVHNIGLPGSISLHLCLDGCDASANPACTGREADTAAVNRRSLGPPVPLIVAGIPLCLLRQLDAPPLADMQANVATGAIVATLALRLDVHRSSVAQICPQCSAPGVGANGACDTGARQARACVTTDVRTVSGPHGDDTYALSPDCPPAGQPIGSVSTRVALTTAESLLPGPRPCGAREDDACVGGCATACQGDACAAIVAGRCIDRRGGPAQLCCDTDPQRPCFPTSSGAAIARAGNAAPPTPPFGDERHPKRGAVTLVGTACAPGSGSVTIDALAGLPGPLALVLPAVTVWER